MPTENNVAPNIQMALDYSRNFATAKPNIGRTEKEHIEGLANLLERTALENSGLHQRLNAADERVDAGIAFVTRMIKCAGGQPSIATSYLCDILDKLKPAGDLNPSTCTWSQDASGVWNSTCGVTWAFMDGSPISHGMHFCHSCGKTLVVEGEGHE